MVTTVLVSGYRKSLEQSQEEGAITNIPSSPSKAPGKTQVSTPSPGMLPRSPRVTPSPGRLPRSPLRSLISLSSIVGWSPWGTSSLCLKYTHRITTPRVGTSPALLSPFPSRALHSVPGSLLSEVLLNPGTAGPITARCVLHTSSFHCWFSYKTVGP